MKYSPASAAACLTSQGKSTTPHSAGTLPPTPKGDRDGKGMSYGPSKAAKCLNEWGRESDAPSNSGPMKSW